MSKVECVGSHAQLYYFCLTNPDFIVRCDLALLKSFLLEEQGYWGGKERNGKEELTWVSGQGFLGRSLHGLSRKETESVGKSEEKV